MDDKDQIKALLGILIILLTIGLFKVGSDTANIKQQNSAIIDTYKAQADSAILMSEKATLQTRRCLSMLKSKNRMIWLQKSQNISSH